MEYEENVQRDNGWQEQVQPFYHSKVGGNSIFPRPLTVFQFLGLTQGLVYARLILGHGFHPRLSSFCFLVCLLKAEYLYVAQAELELTL